MTHQKWCIVQLPAQDKDVNLVNINNAYIETNKFLNHRKEELPKDILPKGLTFDEITLKKAEYNKETGYYEFGSAETTLEGEKNLDV